MSKFLIVDSKEMLFSNIEHARERLENMSSSDTTRISTLGCNYGFVCVLDGIRLELNSSSSIYDDYATVMYNTALIYMKTRSFSRAKKVLEFVISMVSARKNCDLNCMKLFLAASNNLGWIHQTQHMNQYGADMFAASINHAHDQNAIQYTETQLIVAAILCNIGTIQVTAGNYDKALEVFNVSLDIIVKAAGENHPDAACILLKIGKVQFELGKTSDSTKSFLDVIRIQRMAFGNDNILVAEPMYRLGMIFESLEEYENALNAYEQTAQIELTTLGSNHSGLATTFHDIGRMHYEKGNIDLALQAHKKDIVIMEVNSDMNCVFATSIFLEIGKIYREIGMIKESKKAFSSSKKILLQLKPEQRDGKIEILIGLVDFFIANPPVAATA